MLGGDLLLHCDQKGCFQSAKFLGQVSKGLDGHHWPNWSPVTQFPSLKMQNIHSFLGLVKVRKWKAARWLHGLEAWPVASLLSPLPSSSPCIRCMFNYASFPVLIRDLQTALKISSFSAYFVLVKFLSQLKKGDKGIKPDAEAHEWEAGKISGAAVYLPTLAVQIHPFSLVAKTIMVLIYLESQGAWKQCFQSISQCLCSLKLLGRTLKEKGILLLFTFLISPIVLWAFSPPGCSLLLAILAFWGSSEPISSCDLAWAIWRLFARLLWLVGLCHGLTFPSLLLLPSSPSKECQGKGNHNDFAIDWPGELKESMENLLLGCISTPNTSRMSLWFPPSLSCSVPSPCTAHHLHSFKKRRLRLPFSKFITICLQFPPRECY